MSSNDWLRLRGPGKQQSKRKKEMMLNVKQKRGVRLKSVVKPKLNVRPRNVVKQNRDNRQKLSLRQRSVVLLKPNVRLMPLRNLSCIALDQGQAFPLVEMV